MLIPLTLWMLFPHDCGSIQRVTEKDTQSLCGEAGTLCSSTHQSQRALSSRVLEKSPPHPMQDVLYCAVSESGVAQMKFTASAIMSRIYKMLIQVRPTPPIPNQKSALNLTERHFHFQHISMDSCLAPWLHVNEDKNKTSCIPAQPHCRSTPVAGDGFLEQNFS